MLLQGSTGSSTFGIVTAYSSTEELLLCKPTFFQAHQIGLIILFTLSTLRTPTVSVTVYMLLLLMLYNQLDTLRAKNPPTSGSRMFTSQNADLNVTNLYKVHALVSPLWEAVKKGI